MVFKKGHNINLGKKNRLGKRHSDETKRKMSEAWKNRGPISEETKRKMSEAQMGRRNQEFNNLQLEGKP